RLPGRPGPRRGAALAGRRDGRGPAVILAIDQGTTGTTCLVVDDALRAVGRGYREIEQHFPEPGWVEHDPEEIWASVESAAGEARRRPPMSRPVPSPRSGSRISVRRRSSGSGARAAPWDARSCGRTGAPPPAVRSFRPG